MLALALLPFAAALGLIAWNRPSTPPLLRSLLSALLAAWIAGMTAIAVCVPLLLSARATRHLFLRHSLVTTANAIGIVIGVIAFASWLLISERRKQVIAARASVALRIFVIVALVVALLAWVSTQQSPAPAVPRHIAQSR